MKSTSIISVIVCTHNPRADYFRRVLAALREQTLALNEWELLIIDNSSAEPVESRFDITWHPNGRCVIEHTLGLTPARLRGIDTAKSELLVFVDDDNVLDINYLKETIRIGSELPLLGAWGAGIFRPEFESQPPDWTKPYWRMLAVGEIDRDIWSNISDSLTTVPCGAGLTVRSEVAKEYQRVLAVDIGRLKLDRQGTSLLSGGDTDLALTACDMRMGTGMFRTLALTHLIHKGRISLSHLSALAEAMAFSGELLWSARGRVTPNARRGILSRILQAYHRLRIPKEHRAILDARERGIDKARRLLSKGAVVGELHDDIPRQGS